MDNRENDKLDKIIKEGLAAKSPELDLSFSKVKEKPQLNPFMAFIGPLALLAVSAFAAISMGGDTSIISFRGWELQLPGIAFAAACIVSLFMLAGRFLPILKNEKSPS